MTTTLHYFFDPFCGWCYAAAPLLKAARDVTGLRIALHGGGMMAGPNAQRVTPALRDYVMPHDRRIAATTGQPFGIAYFDGLLRDGTAVFDSAPPTAAILAAESLGGHGARLLHRLQQAHYVDGLRIADGPVLQTMAEEVGLDAGAFATALARTVGATTQQHIEDTRALMRKTGIQGFPGVALETADGRLQVVDAGRYLGQPAAWQALLAERVGTPSAAEAVLQTDARMPAGAAAAARCGPDACAR
ncbi:DsbA family protein [Xylophilus sp. Leaf220]|uniref:DsbA family protein n=1 Tax=Xylophilus sp. Leaf220 TaxID=1735686 RepID=UPI0006FE5E73|nr:DsbA family protein [Xylophilus sp. Leaf220]KQM68678.1 protein-disulfide isomerase [Xylophilus sp. Leaf220]